MAVRLTVWWTAVRRGLTPTGGRRRSKALVAVLSVLLTTMLAAGAARCVGVHFLHVRSASMGTAAPVGSLVVTVPTRLSQLKVGDLVALRPNPDDATVVTHRVVQLVAEGALTRGDNNAATDPWVVREPMILGRGAQVWWGAGAVLRAAPPVALGSALMVLLARRFHRVDRRRAVLIAGIPVVIALVLAAQRPLVGVVSLGTEYVRGRDLLRSDVVSTGLLPTAVEAERGESVEMADGQMHRFEVAAQGRAGTLIVHASPALRGPALLAVGMIVLTPLMAALISVLRRGGVHPATSATPATEAGTAC